MLAALEAGGISPSPEADRYTLIKRLYYDLLGLLPPSEDVERFVRAPVHINDFHATILQTFGLNHLQLTRRYQGLDARLTAVGGRVIHDWLA